MKFDSIALLALFSAVATSTSAAYVNPVAGRLYVDFSNKAEMAEAVRNLVQSVPASVQGHIEALARQIENDRDIVTGMYGFSIYDKGLGKPGSKDHDKYVKALRGISIGYHPSQERYVKFASKP